jgi:hypothetical protein
VRTSIEQDRIHFHEFVGAHQVRFFCARRLASLFFISGGTTCLGPTLVCHLDVPIPLLWCANPLDGHSQLLLQQHQHVTQLSHRRTGTICALSRCLPITLRQSIALLWPKLLPTMICGGGAYEEEVAETRWKCSEI